MIKKTIIFFFLLIVTTKLAFAEKQLYFEKDRISVGSCNLTVLVAKSNSQQANGMLGFTDKTFPTEGMIFLGNKFTTHYYHTMGMQMNIRIMGVNSIGKNKYIVNNEVLYAPIGKASIKVKGESILEIPETLYQKYIKNCLYN